MNIRSKIGELVYVKETIKNMIDSIDDIKVLNLIYSYIKHLIKAGEK